MNKVILSLVSCSGSIATVLAAGTVTNSDTAKTIPYPEVMNLQRVPTFNDRGMIPQSEIVREIVPKQDRNRRSLATPKSVPLTVDLVSKAVSAATIRKYDRDCLGCRDLSPSMMVMGYSSAGITTSQARLSVY